MEIMETIEEIPFPVRKVRLDHPRSLAEANALEQFKIEVESWMDEVEEDYFFLRWLRARHLNIEKAKSMLWKYLEYRRTNTYIEDISVASYYPLKIITDQASFGMSGTDFEGRPVFIGSVGQVNFKELFEKGYKDDCYRFAHYLADWVMYVSEVERRKSGSTQVNAILDFDGFSFGNALHVQTIQAAIYGARMFEAFYPETLHRSIMVNANWVFSSLYNMTKPFLSTETTDKIQVYGHDTEKWKAVLKQYIPNESIPIEYGGTAPSLYSGQLTPKYPYRDQA